ncbi:MAG: CAP domain-containing protein [Candidatus Saccharimonadales bacterium]
MALTTPNKRKPPVAHKRRVGQHHKQSKQYVKHYWPYLPMLMIAGLGLFINSLWTTPAVLGDSSDYSNAALLDATNNSRGQSKLQPLTLSASLSSAARAKAQDMVAKDYWAHNSPDGKTPWDFLAGAGYQYQAAGENLAYGFRDASSTQTGWMNSSEHRANVLSRAYSQVGFAVVSSPNYLGKGPSTIVVAEYASPTQALATITFKVDDPTTQDSPAVKAANTELASKNVARIQLITGGHATWSLFAMSVLACSALLVFLLRHGLYLRRLILQSEAYISHHPVLDIIVVTVITAGFLLTRSSGIIR